MENLKLITIIFILPVMIFSYNDFIKTTPIQLHGTVEDIETGKPIASALLFVVKGNEENITNNKGEFKLATWQKLPLTLTIEHADYNTENIKVTEGAGTLKIKIRKK